MPVSFRCCEGVRVSSWDSPSVIKRRTFLESARIPTSGLKLLWRTCFRAEPVWQKERGIRRCCEVVLLSLSWHQPLKVLISVMVVLIWPSWCEPGVGWTACCNITCFGSSSSLLQIVDGLQQGFFGPMGVQVPLCLYGVTEQSQTCRKHTAVCETAMTALVYL